MALKFTDSSGSHSAPELSDYKAGPELVFSWIQSSGEGSVLMYRAGKNLDAEGRAGEWTRDLGSHAFPVSPVAGNGIGISRTKAGNLSLLYGWAAGSGTDAGFHLATAAPALANPVAVTDKDLSTVGDETTGFSTAAVKAQMAAGMTSPHYLIQHSKKYVKDPKSLDELSAMVNNALDAIQPPLPAEVRPEVENYLLEYYGVSGGTGL